MQEKNEHNKLKQQNMKILEELRSAQSAIEKLNSKNSTMLENYRKLFVEKEHILTELRKLTSLSSTTKSPPPAPQPAPRRSGHTCKPPSYGAYQERGLESRYLKTFHGGYVERDGLTLTMQTDASSSNQNPF